MKINAITPNVQKTILNSNLNIRQSNQIEESPTDKTLPSPTSSQLMSYNPAFCGGYSLNLAETIQNLDKLATKHSDIYPKNVREWAGMILEEGNKGKETLISIHKRLYESIKDCFSLKELKEKFPEFKDVKSISEVEFREGTLLDDLQKGNLEFFNNEEDISLQLIKLYWGEGFSLNDLKAYAGGKDLNYVMNKLNIPKVNVHYGHVLKFSDPEYNERLTKQMAKKRLETMDIKAQQMDGEPVYIKRGPLSEEHKKHISEGLLKHYRENPERIFAMSERQKQYYIDNPDQAEMLHRVMVKAWYMPGMEDIRRALSKFLKGKNVAISEDEMLSPSSMPKNRASVMKQFWGINDWAKKRFSKSVDYAWKKVKEEQDMFYTVDLTPKLFKQRFFIWCEKEGIDTTNLSFDDLRYYPHRPELNRPGQGAELSKYTPKYIDSCEGDESQKLANSYQRTMIKFGKFLATLEKEDVSSDTKNTALFLRRMIHYGVFDPDKKIMGSPMARTLDAQEIQQLYVNVSTMLMDRHEDRLIRKLVSILNDSYNYLDKNWKAGHPVLLDPQDVLF